MGQVKNTERDKQIRELAMTEDVATLAQMTGVSKERIRQVLFTIPDDVKARIVALHSCEDYTNEMISEQLQVPLVTVEYYINKSKNGRQKPCPEDKVEVGVKKTDEVEWERTKQPALTITKMTMQVIISKEDMKKIIQDWIVTCGKFTHTPEVHNLVYDAEGNLVVYLNV